MNTYKCFIIIFSFQILVNSTDSPVLNVPEYIRMRSASPGHALQCHLLTLVIWTQGGVGDQLVQGVDADAGGQGDQDQPGDDADHGTLDAGAGDIGHLTLVHTCNTQI